MITLTSAEAQNNFGRLLDTAQREPVAITRHGRTTAYVISQREMDEIEAARERRKRAVAELTAWRDKARESMTAEAAALTDEDVVKMVHEARDEIARGL
jgi:antitoxin Phd